MPAVPTGPTLVPELATGTLPLHPSDPEPPLAVQEVAPLEIHVSTTDWPVCMAVGVAEKLEIDAGAGLTVRVAVAVAPAPWPTPTQLSV